MAELRSFIFLDQLQPQTLCTLATWIRGSLPRARMADVVGQVGGAEQPAIARPVVVHQHGDTAISVSRRQIIPVTVAIRRGKSMGQIDRRGQWAGRGAIRTPPRPRAP